MKHSFNSATMTPHDPARRFFPEFTRMTVYVGKHKASGPVSIDMDDSGAVTLRFECGDECHEKQATKPVEMPAPKPTPVLNRLRGSRR